MNGKSIVVSALLALTLLACDQAAPWRARGRAALEVQDYARAVTAWNAILDLDPSDQEARHGLALALFSAARENDSRHETDSAAALWQRSAQELRILLQLDSAPHLRSMASTSIFHVARQRMDEDRLEDALDLLQEATRLDSANSFAWNLEGLVLEGLGKPDSAAMLYTQVLLRDSSFIAAYINLGNLHWNSHREADAAHVWTLGLAHDSGNVYLKQWVGRARGKTESRNP